MKDPDGVVTMACSTSGAKSVGLTTQKDDTLAHLIRRVFNEDLLREMIISHLIRGKENGLSRPDICSARLVQKDWLRGVTKCLRKSKEPLFQLDLNKDNSVNGSPMVLRHGKMLDRFTSAIKSSSFYMGTFPPPISLQISLDFFRDQNHQSFSEFLKLFGTGLVELDMTIPENGGSMTLIFPPASSSFPNLQRLIAKFAMEGTAEDDNDDTVTTNGSNSNFIPFLQSILNGAPDLKMVHVPFCRRLTIVPAGIRYVILPRSVTKLDLNCVLNSSQLQFLVKNHLPNLTILNFMISQTPLSEGLVFQILDPIKAHLRQLCLGGLTSNGQPRHPTFLQFPRMEYLKVCQINGMHAELDSQQLAPLPELLPAMTDLLLYNETVDMFRKWAVNSPFPNVSKVLVDLANENAPYDANSLDYPVTINLERMQILHLAFPNVRNLDITLSGMETCGLKYLFLEMTQLTRLKIRVKGNAIYTSSDHWDGVLIGVPSEWAMALRTNPDFWDYIQLKDNGYPNIKDLTCLESLALSANCSPPPENESVPQPLISDVLFHFALLKMPKLNTLTLQGRFLASPEMTQLWKDQQRKLVYLPPTL